MFGKKRIIYVTYSLQCGHFVSIFFVQRKEINMSRYIRAIYRQVVYLTEWRRAWSLCNRLLKVFSGLPYPPLDNIRVMVIVWRLREYIIRTAPCWVVWHSVHSQQHTHVSSSYRSSRLGSSHWDPYAMHRGGCLELHYCNMVEWSWWDSSFIC